MHTLHYWEHEHMADTPATKAALKWLREHGGSAAIAKTTAGGRIYLAQGETGPFTSGTVKQLIDAGKVTKADGRITIC